LRADRAYGDWREMLAGEKGRPDRIDLVTVATPNATHYEITKAFLEAGFHVLCEKPMTMTVEEGEDIVRTRKASGNICAVNYGYTGLPDGPPHEGDGGAWRSWKDPPVVKANFSHGHHAEAMMPTIRACAGATIRRRPGCRRRWPIAAFMRCTWRASSPGRRSKRLSADTASCISSRELEDDAMVNFRTAGRNRRPALDLLGRDWSPAWP
jgi:hypothetical protein